MENENNLKEISFSKNEINISNEEDDSNLIVLVFNDQIKSNFIRKSIGFMCFCISLLGFMTCLISSTAIYSTTMLPLWALFLGYTSLSAVVVLFFVAGIHFYGNKQKSPKH